MTDRTAMHRFKKLFSNDLFIGALLALIAFAVYLKTLAPGVGPFDAGELATAAYTLGVAHPSGYPLFTLLGWVFSRLPLGGSVIWKLNLMSAFFSGAAVFGFYRTFLLLLGRYGSTPPKKPGKRHAGKGSPICVNPNAMDRLVAASTSVVFAFSQTFWEQALNIEVYALHLLLLSLVLWLFLRAMDEKATVNAWRGFAFALGLGFTNHLTLVLLAPAFLYLFFSVHGFSGTAWKKILQAVPPFLLPLSLYLYLPLRASQHPWANWGDPSSWQNFWWHVTTHQFQSQMFSSSEVISRQATHFFSRLAPTFGYIPLLLGATGLIGLWRQNRKTWIFTALLFAGCLAFSLNYNFRDTDSFFLLADVAVAVWILFGARALLERLGRNSRIGILPHVACGALFLFPLCLHFTAINESRDYATEDYARNVLNALPPNALLLSDQGSALITPGLYLQKVEGVRTDVTLLDYTMLASSWFYRELETRRPWLVRNSRPQIENLIAESRRVDGLSALSLQDTLQFSRRLLEMVQSFLHESSGTHPLYVTGEIFSDFTGGWLRLPEGLVYRLAKEVPTITPSLPPISFRPIPPAFPMKGTLEFVYATGYTNQGIYAMLARKDTVAARRLLDRALELKPHLELAYRWRQIAGP